MRVSNSTSRMFGGRLWQSSRLWRVKSAARTVEAMVQSLPGALAEPLGTLSVPQ
jgi:hypothetical protein